MKKIVLKMAAPSAIILITRLFLKCNNVDNKVENIHALKLCEKSSC